MKRLTRTGFVVVCLLALIALDGCMWNPSDAVKGAQGTLAIYDANSSKPAIEYITGGASVAASKIRLADSPKTGRVLTIGAVGMEDTVAEQQGQAFQVQQQAYLAGATTAMQLVGALMGKQITPGTTVFSPWQPNTGASVPALPGAEAPAAGNVAAMLAACDTPEEQQAVLKALGLLPKAKTPAPAKTVKKPAATQPATTQPVTPK